MQEKRILHIMSSFGGGISTFIANLASQAQSQRLIFDVVTYHVVPEHFKKMIEASGGHVYYMVNPKIEGWRAFKKSFVNVLQTRAYQAVYCHISGYRALAYYYLVKRTNPILVEDFYIHAHYLFDPNKKGLKNRLTQWIDPYINRSLSRIPVGCSSQAVQSLFGLKAEVPFVVIPNSINSQDFFLDDTTIQAHYQKQHQGLEPGTLVVGQVGRLEPIKNHQFSLQIVKESREGQHPIHLLIAGQGASQSSLEQRVEEMGLDSMVQFMGRLSPISGFLAGLDAVILPSIAEGFGTIVVEAQASGIPVLISDAVTLETDLGLGLIQQCELSQGPRAWYDALVQLIGRQKKRPSVSDRQAAIEAHAFSNAAALAIYRRMIDYQLNEYYLEER